MVETWRESKRKSQNLANAVEAHTRETKLKQEAAREEISLEIHQTGDSKRFGGFFRILDNHLSSDLNSLLERERIILLSVIGSLSEVFGENYVEYVYRSWKSQQSARLNK